MLGRGMSPMKKKSFSFEEEELDWINPLLVEWSKENEGNQSDLVLQLLRDYRDRGPTLKDTLDETASTMKVKLSDYSSRSKVALDGFMGKSKEGLQTVQSKVKTGSDKLVEQLRKVEADVRKKIEENKAERETSKEDSAEKK